MFFPIWFGFTIEIKPPFSSWWMMMARPPHKVINVYFIICLQIWFEFTIEIESPFSVLLDDDDEASSQSDSYLFYFLSSNLV